MTITLYYNPLSPPARCAYWVSRLLGLEVEIKIINVGNKEHLTEEYLKINPQHLIPTLKDGDFILWESGAIAAYLVNSYGKDDKLYPKDPKKRAVVDQRLHFGNGTLFPRLLALCSPVFHGGQTKLNADKKNDFEEAIRLLNIFLEKNKFIVGDHYTIGDIALITTVSNLYAAGWKFTAYKNVTEWITRCEKEIPGYSEINQVGADQFGMVMKEKLDPPNQF